MLRRIKSVFIPWARSYGKADWIPLGLLILWTLAASLILPDRGHFLDDEAVFYYHAILSAHGKILPILGPHISGTTAYTPGGFAYSMLAVPFLFSPDPRYCTLWLILLSAFGILFLHWTLRRVGYSSFFAGTVTLLLTWTPWHSTQVDRIWNAHLYTFASPLLISLSLLIKKYPSRWWLFFAWGLVSALLVQIHLSGLLLIGTTGAYILWKRDKLSFKSDFKSLLAAFFGFSLLYVPYFWVEATNGFTNTRNMLTAPKNSFHWMWVRDAVCSPFAFVSLFHSTADLNPFINHGFEWFVAWIVSLFCILFYFIGLKRKDPLRILFVGSLVLISLFFSFIRRGFVPHYVLVCFPIFILTVAAGAESFRAQGLRTRMALNLWIFLFCALGGVKSATRYLVLADEMSTTAYRVEAAKKLSQDPGFRNIDTESKLHQEFWNWTLATSIYQADPKFRLIQTHEDCVMRYKQGCANGFYHQFCWVCAPSSGESL